jgi:hypothetical protein
MITRACTQFSWDDPSLLRSRPITLERSLTRYGASYGVLNTVGR